MTTSAYMPDVVVEIAFNAGYATAAASRTWTDVSAYVNLQDGVTITAGRGDEFAESDANHLSLVVDNTDGRFSPEYASGAYYPNIKIGRPIRVKSTRPGGAAVTRFLGFIDEWPVEWDGAVTHPTAKLTASSRLARIGLSAVVESSLLSACLSLSASPRVLYRLNEAASPASDSSTNLQPSLTQTRSGIGTWRGGVGPDGVGTAFRSDPFAASPGYAQLLGPTASSAYSPKVVEFFIYVPSTPDDSNTITNILWLETPAGLNGISFSADDVNLTAQSATSFGGTLVTPYARDVVNHVAVAMDGTSARMYLNGTVVATSVTTPAALPSVNWIIHVGYRATPDSNRHNDLSYVMLSDDESGIATRSELRSGGTTVSDAIVDYAVTAGIEAAERSIDTTTETIASAALSNQSPLAAMRTAEATDGGVLFDAPDGKLTYRNRASRFTEASAFTLAAASQEIETDFAPKLDRSSLYNTATITGSSDATATQQDVTSIAEYGLGSLQRDTLGNYDLCLQAAFWVLFLYKDPTVRVASLTVDLLALSNAKRDSISAATIGTRFTVTGLPAQAPASSMDFFIEGWSEAFGPESHRMTFNLSQRAAANYDVWTVEDAVLGQYDAYPIAW